MIESLNNLRIGTVRLRVEMIGRARYFDQRDFAIHLDQAIVFRGRYFAGRPSIYAPGWIDGEFVEHSKFDAEPLARAIGAVIPPGGRLFFAYESFDDEGELARETRAGLQMRVPIIATPLGYLLFYAGCWTALRDWDIPEGGREGPRKVQGNKPIDAQHAHTRAIEMIAALESFAQKRTVNEIQRRAQERIRLVGPAIRVVADAKKIFTKE